MKLLIILLTLVTGAYIVYAAPETYNLVSSTQTTICDQEARQVLGCTVGEQVTTSSTHMYENRASVIAILSDRTLIIAAIISAIIVVVSRLRKHNNDPR